jgi:hypothetical protein
MNLNGKTMLLLGLAAVAAPALILARATTEPPGETTASGRARVFELRTYHALPGRLDALNKRFRDHTCRLFKKHGMEIVGFWTPQDDDKGKADTLVYILAFPSREAAAASWKAFQGDDEWKAVREESERDGKIVANVDSVYLDPTDYSAIK